MCLAARQKDHPARQKVSAGEQKKIDATLRRA